MLYNVVSVVAKSGASPSLNYLRPKLTCLRSETLSPLSIAKFLSVIF